MIAGGLGATRPARRARPRPDTSRADRSRRGLPDVSRRVLRGLRPGLLCAVLLVAACRACPPRWLERLPEQEGHLLATGSCGEVYVDAEARDVALTRAARRLADALGVDAEVRLSATWLDGRVWVELVGASGPSDALDALELVDVVRCDGATHVLVRLPRG